MSIHNSDGDLFTRFPFYADPTIFMEKFKGKGHSPARIPSGTSVLHLSYVTSNSVRNVSTSWGALATIETKVDTHGRTTCLSVALKRRLKVQSDAINPSKLSLKLDAENSNLAPRWVKIPA